jgi:hypothetical protein
MKLIPLLLLITSCSLLNKLPWTGKDKKLIPQKYEYMGATDYLDHINNLGEEYLKSKDVKVLNISSKSKLFIETIVAQILNNNGNIFKAEREIKIHIVKSNSPFYFGLPNGKIFLSSSLLKKYLTNENLLALVLASEMMRIEKRTYQKVSIVPLGYISTERLISLTRIPFEERTELNKWTFYISRRAGFDSQEVLSWIQLRNKNTLDFSLQIGDTQQVAREESLFKNFLIKKAIDNADRKKNNSSKNFYEFSNEIERLTL